MSKRLRSESPVGTNGQSIMQIGTHNGHFHADEALAVYMLRSLPLYRQSKLVRTRDPALLETCHTVVDVGGEYVPERNRFDHHQRTFSSTFPGRPTKLSSAGLVYLHFGKDLIRRQLTASAIASNKQAQQDDLTQIQSAAVNPDDKTVDLVWNKLYTNFVEALDAEDNGISVFDPAQVDAAGLQKRYHETSIGLGALISDLNSSGNDDMDSKGQTGTPEATAKSSQLAVLSKSDAEDYRFVNASAFIGAAFQRRLRFYCGSWLPARQVVHEAFSTRRQAGFGLASQGRILLLPQSVPWKDHLYTLEQEEADANDTDDAAAAAADEAKHQVYYVLYPENPDANDSKWRIQAVPVNSSSFMSRLPLPEAWRGIRDEELSTATGVPGCIFVHASGFIGGNATEEGALRMAQLALAKAQTQN